MGSDRPTTRRSGRSPRGIPRSTPEVAGQGRGVGRTATSTRSRRPGLAALTLPPISSWTRWTLRSAARAAADNAHATAHDHWHSHAPAKYFGFSVDRARRVQREVAQQTPIVWALTLFGAVLPGDRTAPPRPLGGGAGRTRVRHRRRGNPRAGDDRDDLRRRVLLPRRLGGARLRGVRDSDARTGGAAAASAWSRSPGWLRGLAVCFEYPLALLAAILFFYALARARPASPCRRVRAAAARGRGAGAPLQPVVAGIAAPLRLLLRGLGSRAQRSRGAGAELQRLLRDHRSAARRRDRPASLGPRPAHPDAGAGHGRGRSGR